MHRIIAGGTGLIGKQLAEHWLKQQHAITIVGRSQQHIEKVFGTRVQALTWEQLTREVLQSADVVVNLAGANVAEKRWNDARRQEIIDSRIESTKKIAGLLAELGKNSPPLFNANAMGIYGLQVQLPDQLPPRFDENTPIDWKNSPDFLSSVARRWEQATQPAVAAGVRVVLLRFGIVLAKEGGALPMIKKPFELYLGGPTGTGQQPFCWVALDDVIRAIDFLLATPDAAGAFNIVAPECITQGMLTNMLGKLLDRPTFFRMPAFLLKLIFGKDMARELLLEGQHVYPQRLLELGFRFSYPDIESALNHILR